MRSATLAVLLALVTPAAASGIPDATRWSMDVHNVQGGRSLDAVLQAHRVGQGRSLTLTCETTDVRAHRVVARERHAGVGARSATVPCIVEGLLDGSRITVGFPDDGPRLLTAWPGCPAGEGNLGCGD